MLKIKSFFKRKEKEFKCEHEEIFETTCFGDDYRSFKCKICGKTFTENEIEEVRD